MPTVVTLRAPARRLSDAAEQYRAMEEFYKTPMANIRREDSGFEPVTRARAAYLVKLLTELKAARGENRYVRVYVAPGKPGAIRRVWAELCNDPDSDGQTIDLNITEDFSLTKEEREKGSRMGWFDAVPTIDSIVVSRQKRKAA